MMRVSVPSTRWRRTAAGAKRIFPAGWGITDDDAWKRRVEVAGFQVCSIDDIIRSKRAANREKDRESLVRLESFRDYLNARPRA